MTGCGLQAATHHPGLRIYLCIYFYFQGASQSETQRTEHRIHHRKRQRHTTARRRFRVFVNGGGIQLYTWRLSPCDTVYFVKCCVRSQSWTSTRTHVPDKAVRHTEAEGFCFYSDFLWRFDIKHKSFKLQHVFKEKPGPAASRSDVDQQQTWRFVEQQTSVFVRPVSRWELQHGHPELKCF